MRGCCFKSKKDDNPDVGDNDGKKDKKGKEKDKRGSKKKKKNKKEVSVSSVDSDDVVHYSPLSVDQQIAMYDQLQNAMYPDYRRQKIMAANAHLRQQILYTSAYDTKPRTARESQWLEAHFEDPQVQEVRASTSPGQRRKTLHEMYMHDQHDVDSKDTRRSFRKNSNPQPWERESGGEKSKKSLAEIAENPGREASRVRWMTPTKQSIMYVLELEDTNKKKSTSSSDKSESG